MFIDETGAPTKPARRHGRAPRGERLRMSVPHGHWKTTTFVGALRLTGMTAPMVLDRAMTGAWFLAYVEQVLSLYDVDHTLLAGVPNNAFTEALAFVFQAKDLELLGLSKPDAESERLRVLNDFWMTWEIAGVALLDAQVWHWLYEHPNATPKQLREATVKLAQALWRKHYAKVLGGDGTPLLGIYSHMVSYPLYLFGYPLGHLIAFQIEAQMRKAGALGPEFERMAKVGNVAPDVWMQQASGSPVSAEPLLRATEAALGGSK